MKTEYLDEGLSRYAASFRKERSLSRAEEYQLFVLAGQGNRKAKDRLVAANMRFVLKVAQQYRGCSLPLADLVNEGAMGLLRAIESFDHSRGLKFITYAVWWVKAYITRAINERGSLVRLPANQHLRLRKAIRERGHGKEMDEELQTLQQIGDGAVSLDAPLETGSKLTFGDVLSDERLENPDGGLEGHNLQEFARKLLDRLPEREAQVVAGLYGIGMDAPRTVREVGHGMHVSRERVRQLRDQGVRRIRNLNFDGHLNEAVDDFMSLAYDRD
jgi:RNA polymerase primary sigma factor